MHDCQLPLVDIQANIELLQLNFNCNTRFTMTCSPLCFPKFMLISALHCKLPFYCKLPKDLVILQSYLVFLTCHFILLSFISTLSCHTNTLNHFIFCCASAFNLQALKAIFGKSFHTVKLKKAQHNFTHRNCSY